ncbi:hypothetical protein NL108_005402 [Boleophthalmus pectinirostris]|nr:hypothetical protein NL108_005402 [Boleophthalmus pectinirostris]
MIDPGEDSANSGVYDEMGAAGSASTANRQKEQRVSDAEEGEEEDPYTEFGVGEIYDTIENPKPSVVIPNRPPAPTPRPQTTEHEGRISSIAKVFLKKKNQGKIGLLPVSTKKAQGHLGTPSSVYDSIVAAPTPGSKQRARASSLPTDNAKDGNNSGPPVQEGAIQQEKLSQLKATVRNTEEDDDIYDKISIVHHTPSAVAKESKKNSQSEKADFYSKPLKGHHTNFKQTEKR